MRLSAGDIVTIRPVADEARGLQLALVLEDGLLVSVVLLTDDRAVATELDPVVIAPIYGQRTELVAVSLAEAVINRDQVGEVLANIGSEIREEIIGCRYGNSSSDFEHGQWLFPFPLDNRHDWLAKLIRAFRDQFSVDDPDLIRMPASELARLIMSEHEVEEQIKAQERELNRLKLSLDYIRARKATAWDLEESAVQDFCQHELQQSRELVSLMMGPPR